MTTSGEQGRVWTPSPDPTLLTTQQLLRELSSLREIFETRLNGMDKANEVLSETVNRTPTAIQTAVANLREVYDERFSSVQQQIADLGIIRDQKFMSIAQQFVERDVRTEQAATASTQALAAALQAAAKAADKTELSFTKQIDQIQLQIKTSGDASNDRIGELKERIDRGEGQSSGSDQGRSIRHLDDEILLTRQGQSMQRIALAISAVLAVLTIATFILYVTKK
jgi:anti-sigma28 factor (negative regulator of flagellin synthesis)